MVDVGTNGKVGDAGVFAKSKIKKCLLNKSIVNIPIEGIIPRTQIKAPFVVLADDAFPLSHAILKPYSLQGLTPEERVFNYRLSRGRRMVESSFGILATRFRIFLTTIALPPKTVIELTNAAIVLHNVLVQKRKSSYTKMKLITHRYQQTQYNEPESTETQERMTPFATQVDQGHARSGNAIRDLLKDHYMGVGAVPWQWGHFY